MKVFPRIRCFEPVHSVLWVRTSTQCCGSRLRYGIGMQYVPVQSTRIATIAPKQAGKPRAYMQLKGACSSRAPSLRSHEVWSWRSTAAKPRRAMQAAGRGHVSTCTKAQVEAQAGAGAACLAM